MSNLKSIRARLGKPRCFKRPVLVDGLGRKNVVDLIRPFTFLDVTPASDLLRSGQPLANWKAMLAWFTGEGLAITTSAACENDPTAVRVDGEGFSGTRELAVGMRVGIGELEFRIFDRCPLSALHAPAPRLPPTVSIIDGATGATVLCFPLACELTLVGASPDLCDVVIADAPEVGFSILRRPDGDLEVVLLKSAARGEPPIVSAELVTHTKSYPLPRGWRLVVRNSHHGIDRIGTELPRPHWQLTTRELLGRIARRG